MVRSTLRVPAAMASNDLRVRSRRIPLRHRISRDPTIAPLLWSDGSTVTASDERRPAVNTGTFTMTRGESVGSAAPRIQSTRNPIGRHSSPAFLSISNAACLRMSLARLRLCLRPEPAGGHSNNFGLPPTLHLAALVAPGFLFSGIVCLPSPAAFQIHFQVNTARPATNLQPTGVVTAVADNGESKLQPGSGMFTVTTGKLAANISLFFFFFPPAPLSKRKTLPLFFLFR